MSRAPNYKLRTETNYVRLIEGQPTIVRLVLTTTEENTFLKHEDMYDSISIVNSGNCKIQWKLSDRNSQLIPIRLDKNNPLVYNLELTILKDEAAARWNLYIKDYGKFCFPYKQDSPWLMFKIYEGDGVFPFWIPKGIETEEFLNLRFE